MTQRRIRGATPAASDGGPYSDGGRGRGGQSPEDDETAEPDEALDSSRPEVTEPRTGW